MVFIFIFFLENAKLNTQNNKNKILKTSYIFSYKDYYNDNTDYWVTILYLNPFKIDKLGRRTNKLIHTIIFNFLNQKEKKNAFNNILYWGGSSTLFFSQFLIYFEDEKKNLNKLEFYFYFV